MHYINRQDGVDAANRIIDAATRFDGGIAWLETEHEWLVAHKRKSDTTEYREREKAAVRALEALPHDLHTLRYLLRKMPGDGAVDLRPLEAFVNEPHAHPTESARACLQSVRDAAEAAKAKILANADAADSREVKPAALPQNEVTLAPGEFASIAKIDPSAVSRLKGTPLTLENARARRRDGRKNPSRDDGEMGREPARLSAVRKIAGYKCTGKATHKFKDNHGKCPTCGEPLKPIYLGEV